MTKCSAPDVPEEVMLAQGWRRTRDIGGMWLKKDGTPVFYCDLVNVYPPLKAWCESMRPVPVPISLGDFCET
jgi:hypothetical protein